MDHKYLQKYNSTGSLLPSRKIMKTSKISKDPIEYANQFSQHLEQLK